MLTATTMATTKKGAKSFAEIGKEAAHAAQRAALLAALEEHGWNLTHTGEALAMGGPANVLRAIRTLKLNAEYKAARIKRIKES